MSMCSGSSRAAGTMWARTRPPPAGSNPARSSSIVTRGPIRAISGIYARAKKSKVGASGLCVPPSRQSSEGSLAVISAGSTVWSTRPVLPAVPIAKR